MALQIVVRLLLPHLASMCVWKMACRKKAVFSHILMVQDCHVRLNLLVASLAKEKAKHHGAVESLKVVQKVGRRRLAMIGRPFRYISV